MSADVTELIAATEKAQDIEPGEWTSMQLGRWRALSSHAHEGRVWIRGDEGLVSANRDDEGTVTFVFEPDGASWCDGVTPGVDVEQL